MKRPALFFSLLPIMATATLTACESTRKQFDFSKRAPDEFAIETRAPLEMPKSFSSLPPPRLGAQRPQEQSTDVAARETMLGESAARSERTGRTGPTAGEAALLSRSGAAKASPTIRQTIDRETEEIARKEEPGINKLKRWIGQDVEEPANVVDPVAEVNRLKQVRALGKPITTGKTPVIEQGQ